MTLLFCFLLIGGSEPGAPHQSKDSSEESAHILKTSTFHDYVVWEVLRLPERLTRLALAPFEATLNVVEEYRVDRHLVDALTFFDGHALLLPVLSVQGSDGVGGGLQFNHGNVFGNGEEFVISGQVRGNRDFQVQSEYEQDSAALNGRTTHFRFEIEDNKNFRYFGIGAGSRFRDQRALRIQHWLAETTFDLLSREILLVDIRLRAGLRQLRYSQGTDRRFAGVVATGDSVGPPPGFGSRQSFPEFTLELVLDNRDTDGRTTKGWLVQGDIFVTHAIESADQSGVRATLEATKFIEIAPRYRILVLQVGAGVSQPLFPGDAIPLEALISLGRTTHLRGYRRNRFLVRHAWWSTAEYRYPILDYLNTGLTLSATLFVDAAQAGDRLKDFGLRKIRYSYGGGLRADSPAGHAVTMQVGLSREGNEFVASFGGVL